MAIAWPIPREAPVTRAIPVSYTHLDVYKRQAWSFKVLPRLGRIAANDSDSYLYLAESIRTFPNQATLASMMSEAGFSLITVRDLSGGIAAIHAGWRL